jgi:hypothetical protein
MPPTPPPLRIVILHGTPSERGRLHGARFRGEIAAALARLRSAHDAGAMAAAGASTEAAWPLILHHAPDLAAELQGIAEGAAASRTDILLHVGFELFDAPPSTGCTALACRGPDGAIVAQNWDAPPEAAQDLALFIHHGPEGFELAAVASLGGLAWAGCNRHGLALVNNDLMLRGRAPGLPSQVIRRIVLAQRDVAVGLGALRSLPSMAGRSYLLGDAAGAVAGVEVSAGAVRVNQDAAPVLHTNHALDPGTRGDEDEEALARTYPSSRHRLEVLRRRAAGAISVGQVAAILADREGVPDSICKRASPAEPTETLFSIIADCASRTLHLCSGQPADCGYQTIQLG